MSKPRLATVTSDFGSGRRESHDASLFYARFQPAEVSGDEVVSPPVTVDRLFCADARAMTADQVADGSVALVVTSPPYFAGKEYEADMGSGHVPASYAEYLEMLHDVLSVCLSKLEPGGRMAVNVANLGRKPYRSLSADVIGILQDDLGMLLRGEIIWRKAKGAGGSCAWGSYRSPQNPVLRDVTERVIVASKGRFDRALKPAIRKERGLPHNPTIDTDDFLEATLDVWEIPPERATRVGHPAPFPVALPQRLIELYTYHGDLVLDPFMGSGTTAIAALATGRHYVGFEIDQDYLDLAAERIAGVPA
jgi:DNA modification methylase